MWKFAKNLIELIISPDNGWEDVSRTSEPVHSRMWMSVMIAVASVSCLFPLVYSVHEPVLAMIQRLIAVAVTYSATYVIAMFGLSLWIPRINEGVLDEASLVNLVTYSVSLSVIQVILTNLLPITFAILELWPVYVVIIMWRAMRVMGLDERVTGWYLLAVIVSIVVPSQLILRAFDYFISTVG